MDNENKVKKTGRQNRVQVFFDQEFALRQAKPELYSLEQEFAATKKQKNLLFYLSILLFVTALGLGTLVVTRKIEKNADKVTVDISEFKALNLTDLLNKVSKRRDSLQAALQRVKDLRVEMARELKRIEDRFSALKDRARVESASRADLAGRINRLNAQKQQQVSRVINRYQAELDALQKKIDTLKLQVSAADKKLQSDLQAGQQVLDNYQRLNRLQSGRIRREYEQKIAQLHGYYRQQLFQKDLEREKMRRALIEKYNPVFTAQELIRILGAAVPEVKGGSLQWDPLLGLEGVLTKDAFDKLAGMDRDRFLLQDRLLKIPFTNSTATAVSHIAGLDRAGNAAWSGVILRLIKVLRGREETVQRYRSSIQQYALGNREHGYVIAPAGNGLWEIVINRHLPDTGRAIIIRGDNQRIAEVALSRTARRVYGKVVRSYTNAEILPFDKVLLKMRQE